ncbi:MAG TPA: DinB family protein [Thermoanaerobaculia bacterium]|nr:DinB family protein [Thermoanaerobaculia bacterium]
MIAVDTPGDYARGLLTRLGDGEVFAVLEATPAALRAAFDGVGDAAMRMPEKPGKWSMIDVAHHLADSDMVVGVRVRMIVAQDEPPITAYDQDLWSQRLRYREAVLAGVLAQFETMRAANLRLARQLTPAELARYGVHSERGGESAGYLLRLQAGHDLVHLDQIARIRRAVA